MTLAELLVAVGTGSILLLALMSFSIYSGRSLAGLANYVDLNFANRVALDRLTREVRQACRIVECNPHRLALTDFDGQALVYEYFPQDRRLVRTKVNIPQTLLTDCESLNFSLYNRNPVSGTFDQQTTTNAPSSKVLTIRWTCSRNMLGCLNTEGIQSAKIVIRKS